MKFIIRRAVVGALAVPVIAGVYTFGYVALVLAGADPSQNTQEVFNNGIEIGVVLALTLVFSPQLNKFLDRVIGK